MPRVILHPGGVSTHSRSKAAAMVRRCINNCEMVSTHSRSKAAAKVCSCDGCWVMFQLTAARRRLPGNDNGDHKNIRFQLTAARRRLLTPASMAVGTASFNSQPLEGGCPDYAYRSFPSRVSTHSRSKAAALRGQQDLPLHQRFNSQPLEGGCDTSTSHWTARSAFQLTAARRRLP